MLELIQTVNRWTPGSNPDESDDTQKEMQLNLGSYCYEATEQTAAPSHNAHFLYIPNVCCLSLVEYRAGQWPRG